MNFSPLKTSSFTKSFLSFANNEENEEDIELQTVTFNENKLFEKIKKTNEFIKQIEKLNLPEYIKIPRICSIGSQSNGKTSILTNIIGLDILPKGDGVVTRMPLELRLNHLETGEPYIIFEEDKNEKITDFSIIKKKINQLTNKFCGEKKNIKDIPLIINIYSQTCPDLTIIDLPGITKVPVEGQEQNIEEITKNLTSKYISDPYTIILCVIDANQDITTSDGLFLAKQIDYYGKRTLGVLTKVDLMDEGTNCKDILLNKVVPLKLGYIAVKNRSKLDLINKVTIEEGINNEILFFEKNNIYNKMKKNLFGTESLINKLNEVYNKLFYKNIKNIVDSINEHIRRINKETIYLGEHIPETVSEKNLFLLKLFKNYYDIFFNITITLRKKKNCIYYIINF